MDKKLSYEEAMQRLEEIVGTLEAGKAPLAQSMALFEEGTRLSADLTKMLDEAEQKVTLMLRGDGEEPQEVPFDPEETGEHGHDV